MAWRWTAPAASTCLRQEQLPHPKGGGGDRGHHDGGGDRRQWLLGRRRGGDQRPAGQSPGRGGGRGRQPLRRRHGEPPHPKGGRGDGGHHDGGGDRLHWLLRRRQGGDQRQLGYPYGVAVDGTGNLYIADQYNHRIRDGGGGDRGHHDEVAGTGAYGFSGDGGAATSAWPELSP
ncbi:MAG: hypothetical protein R2939_19655 [Kofleriaceae bacterium]